MSEHEFAEMEAARNAFVESYFGARPQLLRTIEKERLIEAGFTAAWRQREREAADALSRPAPVQVPDGWRLVRDGDAIIVSKFGIGGCVVRRDATEAREIPETILWEIADAMLAAAPSAPVAVAQEETALEQFNKFGSTEPMTALERLRFFLSCALKPQDWLDVEQFLDALPVAPASPSVDAEKVMGLVNYYGDCRYSECMANREGDVVAALKEAAEGDGVLAQIRALLTPAAGQGWQLAPVEGDLLPAVGSKVLIHLASADSWVEHTVAGYYVWGDLRGDKRLHRVFVRVVDDSGIPNARMLCDVKPLKPPPAIANREPQDGR